ncbi:MAG TPA: hypothetical protein VNW46_00560 [Gemmatimonadaceae bacterium]|jgi:hypothetical protein|nr:hypothetical protein [Gemmatimonadaceae bacterium]
MAAVEITPDGRVYFTDDQGQRHRVYDVSYGPPNAAPWQLKAHQPPYVGANYRYFVTADGTRRSYQFARSDTRVLTIENLQRQLNSAGYPALERYDSSTAWSPNKK